MVRGRKDEREEDGSSPCEGARYGQGLLVGKHEIVQEILSIFAT